VDAGEKNSLIVEVVGNRILVSDTAGLDPGKGCRDDGEHVSCKGKNVLLVVVHTGDLDDTVRLSGIEAFIDVGAGHDRVILGSQATVVGGPGRDRITGGDGNDVLRGGGGDDVLIGGDGTDVIRGASGDDDLRSKDGEKDRLSGGGGTDEGTVDEFDRTRGVEVLGDF
jgi:Ca2+-binding RTX toxin-like protein